MKLPFKIGFQHKRIIKLRTWLLFIFVLSLIIGLLLPSSGVSFSLLVISGFLGFLLLGVLILPSEGEEYEFQENQIVITKYKGEKALKKRFLDLNQIEKVIYHQHLSGIDGQSSFPTHVFKIQSKKKGTRSIVIETSSGSHSDDITKYFKNKKLL